MQFIKFKSTQVFSNGCLFFCESNPIKLKIITLLEKDLKNFELNKKPKLNNQIKSKYSSSHKNRYLISKQTFLNATNM
jgi:hypothetical protein